MAYKNKYKGRGVHSAKELESICESQYETINSLLSLVQSLNNSLSDIRDFDEDTEEVFDDAGHIASLSIRTIKDKLSKLL